MAENIDVIDYNLRADGWKHDSTKESFEECPFCGENAWIEWRYYVPVYRKAVTYKKIKSCPVCDSAEETFEE